MQITLSSKEFDEAVSLWLNTQGFTTDRYSISTRVIAGRSDGPLGTRLEVQLDQLVAEVPYPFDKPVQRILAATDSQTSSIPSTIETSIPPKRFGQGHADE